MSKGNSVQKERSCKRSQYGENSEYCIKTDKNDAEKSPFENAYVMWVVLFRFYFKIYVHWKFVCYSVHILPLKVHSQVWDNFLAIENPLKMMKNTPYFTSKAHFILKKFKFCLEFLAI